MSNEKCTETRKARSDLVRRMWLPLGLSHVDRTAAEQTQIEETLAMLASAFASSGLHSSAQGSFACGHKLQQRKPLRVVSPVPFIVEAAHKKGGGSTKNGRDSNSKRRGVKVYGGQPIRAGGIIVRQLGTKVCSSLPGR